MTHFDPNPQKAISLLKDCPATSSTPLLSLDGLAEEKGITTLHAKNETNRMGMGSFKALGGVYATAELLRRKANTSDLTSKPARAVAAEMTLCCASAGNHGLSVTAGATVFGMRAVVYIAETVPETFAIRLRAKGAEVVRKGATYEDAMEAAMLDSEKNGWTLVSDSSWEGYREIPMDIMQGYCVMAEELADEFRSDANWPTHVFLQAGVGGMAAALAAHIRQYWDEQPKIIIVEPDRAPCLKVSVENGRPTRTEGEVSNMGRLDCKEPSLVAWEILQEAADRFVTVGDQQAADAALRLEPQGLATTPSGAAGFAALLKEDLPANAHALVIISEGREN